MLGNHILRSGGSFEAATEDQSKLPRRILLVEDDAAVCRLNADVLTSVGYVVDTAQDGESGWAALQTAHYDLLVTDNTMPGITGLELIKKVRSEDIPMAVILASGTVPAEELNRIPWLQVNALLPKPYTIKELLRTVNQVLRKPGGAC
jgi:two-component system, OmpR family, response regulator